MAKVRSPFIPGAQYQVAREFVFNSQTLKPGEAFNGKALGCGERLMRQLYDQRKLELREKVKVR